MRAATSVLLLATALLGLATAAPRQIRSGFVGPSAEPTLLWKQVTAVGAQNSLPVLNGDFMYLQTGPNVLSFTQQQGYIVRVYNSTAPTNGLGYSSPAVQNGVVYFGAENSFFFAYNAQTADRIWEFAVSSPIQSSPLLHNNVLYFGDNQGVVYALRAKDGALIWNSTACGSGNILWSQPQLYLDTIILGVSTTLCSLNITNGALVWSTSTNGNIQSSVTIAGTLVFFGNSANFFYCISAINGGTYWTFSLTNSPIYSAPVVSADGHFVYFADDMGTVTALFIHNGTWLWSSNYFQTTRGPLMLIGDLLVAPADNGVWTFDRLTGDVAWSFLVSETVNGGVAVNSKTNVMYFGDGIGTVYALQLASGPAK